jgi:threonine dehydrogenase-like Zn-dependent dehydrogenase
MENFCQNQKTVGYSMDGGWAKYYCTPENLLLRIPDNVSYEEASMTEPINVVCQALFIKEGVRHGDVVLVQGCGTIGMLNAMVAKALGAKTVIITGVAGDEDLRLPVARTIDAIDYVLNVSEVNLKDEVMKITNGRGVDVIIEASGSEIAIYNMSDVLKVTGTIVVLGETPKAELNLRWNQLLFKSCTIKFSFGEVYEAWVKALELMESKKLELEKLITHRLPLEKFREGFDLLDQKKGLKVLLLPDKND